jgi:hypothetical protein
MNGVSRPSQIIESNLDSLVQRELSPAMQYEGIFFQTRNNYFHKISFRICLSSPPYKNKNHHSQTDSLPFSSSRNFNPKKGLTFFLLKS